MKKEFLELERRINQLRIEFFRENYNLYSPEDYRVAERKYVKYIIKREYDIGRVAGKTS